MKKARQPKGESIRARRNSPAGEQELEIPGHEHREQQPQHGTVTQASRPKVNFYNDGTWPPGREPRN